MTATAAEPGKLGRLSSSFGEVVFDPLTGVVRLPESSYDNGGFVIVCVDVEEWRREYPGHSVTDGVHDILDFGVYWVRFTGPHKKAETGYDPPCEAFRREYGELCRLKQSAMKGGRTQCPLKRTERET